MRAPLARYRFLQIEANTPRCQDARVWRPFQPSSGGDDGGDFVLRESVEFDGQSENRVGDFGISRQRRAVADKVVAWRIVAEVH